MAENILPRLDLRQRQVFNRWTEYQRVVVCCLYRFYKVDNTAFKNIFNSLFAAELRLCGFGDAGMSHGSMITQWHDMRRRGHEIWRRVHIETHSRPEDWTDVLDSIEAAAESLGIELVRKQFDDSDISKFKTTTPKKQDVVVPATVPTPASLQIAPNPPNGADEESTPNPPSAGNEIRSTTICAKGCLWCWWEGLNPFLGEHSAQDEENDHSSESDYVCQEPPQLLYRWYNDDSQGLNSATEIVAGLFAESTGQEVPGPGDCGMAAVRTHIMNHIQRKEISTPFISTFISLLAPIHRAIRAGKGAFISMIDTTKLNVNIYSAQTFVRKERVRIPQYRGYGEYLVWGHIPRDAIISTFSVADLLAICEHHEDICQMLQLDLIISHKWCRQSLKMQLSQGPGRIDCFSGVTIGKLLSLLNVPFNYAGSIGARIAHNWQFSKAITTDEINDFGQGIQTGYALFSGAANFAPTPLTFEAVNTLHEPLLLVDADSEDEEEEEEDETVVELFEAQSRTWVPVHHNQDKPHTAGPHVQIERHPITPGPLSTVVTALPGGASNDPIILDNYDWADDGDGDNNSDMLMILTDVIHSEHLASNNTPTSVHAPRVQRTESFEDERSRIRSVLETGN